MSTRVVTREGMLRAGAVLTRAGPIDYLRSEIGLEGDGSITIHRTMETLRHMDTLGSLRGAPITLGHPPKGVTPDNYQEIVVGAVAGEPRIDSNTIVADVLIGDRDALTRLDDGVDELSIGYDFVLGADGATVGPLVVNHVALVERGRAGSSVRVLDSEPGEDMDKKEIMDAVNDGIAEFLKKRKDDAPAVNASDIAAAVADAMKPMMADMKVMKDAADAAATATASAEAEAKAKKARETLVEEVKGGERARFAIIQDAMPLVAEDKQAALLTAEDPKDVLVAALEDTIPNAKDQSVDFLRGALAIAKGKNGDVSPVAGDDGLPAGVKTFTPVVGIGDKRSEAMKSYETAQAEAYQKAGGV